MMHRGRLRRREHHGKPQRHGRAGSAAIVGIQRTLLWLSLYIIAGSTYILAVGAVDKMTLAETLVTIVAVSLGLPDSRLLLTSVQACVSVLYIVLHNFAAYHARRTPFTEHHKSKMGVQWLATLFLRISVTIWLLTCGLSITFTLARRPDCLSSHPAAGERIDVGATCGLNRSIIAASLLVG